MDRGIIGIIASDMRQIYMADLLKEKGYDIRLFSLMEKGIPTADTLSECSTFWEAGILILPVPVTRIPWLMQLADCVIAHRQTIGHIYGGVFPSAWIQKVTDAGIPATDILQDSSVARENAMATAEGTLAELLKLMPINLEGSHVLVMGFGNCGKLIAEKLYCMGARVSVAARSQKDLQLAGFFGFTPVDLTDHALPMSQVDAVVNTIPAPVLGEKEICSLKKDAVILDIASAPGGCDSDCCRKYDVPYKLALGLPGIYSPKTSAQILLQAMPL